MDTLGMLHLPAKIPSQGQEIPRVAIGGDAPSDAPHGLRGQRRRQIETPRFEVEFRVHGRRVHGAHSSR